MPYISLESSKFIIKSEPIHIATVNELLEITIQIGWNFIVPDFEKEGDKYLVKLTLPSFVKKDTKVCLYIKKKWTCDLYFVL